MFSLFKIAQPRGQILSALSLGDHNYSFKLEQEMGRLAEKSL